MSPIEELRYLVLALQREGNRQLTEALRPLGLTPAQSEVLRVLAQFGELTLIELGERLVCETGSPSRLVKGMVSAGLVQKIPSEVDRRAVLLSLTSNGNSLVKRLDQVEDEYHASLAEMTAHLPVDDVLKMLWSLVGETEAGIALKRRLEAEEEV